MTDITERLRARPTFTPHDQDLLADAADAIESRDATIAELRANLSAIETGKTAEILAMYRGIRDERDELHAAYAKAAIERDELRAQVGVLRADAERLDWIASQIKKRSDVVLAPSGPSARFVQVRHFVDCDNYPVADDLRSAIDAARSQEAAR